MGNEKKIEIPFGAFDSELIHQEINIPNGFNAVIDGNKIILTRVESEDERIRKALISVLKGKFEKDTTINGIRVGDIITWVEKQAEVESDNDDIEAEEEGIRKAFNKIEDEKQCKQKPQRMISAEAKEAMYNKPADTVEPKCEESKTKIFDAPTPFEDKLYAFVLACEILVDPSKREFILEHSQEILDAAKEQIGKEQSSAWSKEDEKILNGLISSLVRIEANTRTDSTSINYTFPREINWLKALKQRCNWKPSEEQMEALDNARHSNPFDVRILDTLFHDLKKLKGE